MVGGWKSGKKEKERKGIVKVTESINESRVALFDDMVQSESRGVVLF